MKKEDDGDWLKWRWEFMRRNPQYKEAYKQALELRREAQAFSQQSEQQVKPREEDDLIADQMFELIKDDRRDDDTIMPGNGIKITEGVRVYPYLDTQWGRQEKKLCESVGHYAQCMTDPAKSFEDIVGMKDSDLEQDPYSRMERDRFRPSTKWSYFTEFDLDREQKRLTITIHLDRINSVGALCKELSRLAWYILSDFVKEFGLKNRFGMQEKERRKSKDLGAVLENGEQIDALYNGVLQADGRKPTYKEIAKQIWPGNWKKRDRNDKNPNTDTLEKQAGDLHRDYRYLVEGGYRELTYP